MSRYLLYDNTMVKLNETYGTLENISDFKAQVYTSEEVDEGIILYPRHRLAFNQELWVAKMSGEAGTVVLAVLPFITGGDGSGGGIGTGTGTDGVNINVNNCDCGCCTDTGTSIATVPSGGTDITVTSDCSCCPSVVIPSSACQCSSGSVKFTFPIVVNVNAPQTIHVPTAATVEDGESDSEETSDFEQMTDDYFNSKQSDGSYTMPTSSSGSNYDFISNVDKYFNDKE